jgi:Tol biopolymer transport system component
MAPLPTAVPGRQLGILDVSPDGTDLLLISAPENSEVHTLWTERILGGSTRRLAEGVYGSFSPDGKAVVCLKANGDIDVVSADGAESRHLASPGSTAKRPVWSPDGKLIRFHKDGRLWEMSSSGENLHPLLPDWHVPGNQRSGRWSPDGKFYFFLLSAEKYLGGQIWAIDEGRRLPWQKAAQPVQLTNGPIQWQQPVPGRDGKTVFAVGDTRRGELSRLDQKSGQLAPFLGGISAEFVSFSRDGKFIAYVSFPDGILWRANRDGSNRTQLTSPPLYPVNPRWSPDGSQIAFADFYIPEKRAVYTVGADGEKNPQKLLPDSPGAEMDPGWSPDGKKVVISESLPPANREEIRILDLTTHRVSAIPGSNGMYSPRWSPDGRYIAVLGREAPFLRIFDLGAQRWSVLPTTGIVAYPCFSSDSQTIYFMRYGLDQGIFRIRIAGGKEERVLDMKDIHLATFLSLSLDLTDSPLVLRDAGTHDVYALALERAKN